jgi:hypothetical protein
VISHDWHAIVTLHDARENIFMCVRVLVRAYVCILSVGVGVGVGVGVSVCACVRVCGCV